MKNEELRMKSKKHKKRNLSKRDAEYFIVDILIASDKIKRYHRELNDAQSFYYDEKSFDATMCELQKCK
jgi:uncharacterized protein with HEPN domain